MKYFTVLLIVLLGLTGCNTVKNTNSPLTMKNGVASIEDPILLGTGRYEDYKTSTSTTPRYLKEREPSTTEQELISRLESLMDKTRVKTFAMVDGDEIVWTGYRGDYLKHAHLLSMSVSKSILSVATGISMCQKNLSFDTKVVELIPELSGTGLADAMVRHLLTMTSGTWRGYRDSSIMSQSQRMKFRGGLMNFMDLLKSKQVSSKVNSTIKPGDVFAYRSTDPLVLGIMLDRANGVPYGEYIQNEILIPAGIEHPAFSGRDFSGYSRVDGVLRMKLMDWVRVAVWIKEQSEKDSCLGNYLQAATTKQRSNVKGSNYPQRLKGYGYLFGTHNEYAPDTYWAVGFGGQEIGWSKNSKKIVLSFSNSDEHVVEFEKIYSEWLKAD